MSTDPKIEAYLTLLEQALGTLSVSERAEILIEIKSHILSSLEEKPDASINEVLASLGSPEAVAQKYLGERGIKTAKKRDTSIFKWLVIGFLGFMVISILSIYLLISSFTPLIDIDESSGRVTLLGGAIDINEIDGTVHIGSSSVSNGIRADQISGSKNLANKNLKTISFQFTNGKFDFLNSDDETLSWKCKIQNQMGDQYLKESSESITFDFLAASAVKCDVHIPKGYKLEIAGSNAKIDFRKPRYSIDAKITNGKVSIEPQLKTTYRYDLKVTNGIIDDFESSDSSEALSIKIDVINGKIDHY